MSNNSFCIIPEPDDSACFGSSVVINNRYLAINDTIANRVIIYTPNGSGQWNRIKEIYPPKSFIDYTSGEHSPIFGKKLELDGDTLTIEASKMLPLPMTAEDNGRQRLKDMATAHIAKRYSIRLDTDAEVSEIELRRKQTDEIIEFNLLRNGKIEKIVIPNNGEERFAESIAIHENWLIVGSPSYDKQGKALIYNLDKSKAKPSIIKDKIDNCGGTVAISSNFAVSNGKSKFFDERWAFMTDIYPGRIKNTLVRNLQTGITTKLESFGDLSISNNILAIHYPSNYLGDFLPLLEVFEIDKTNKIKLILRRQDVSLAWVKNGYLVTVKHLHDNSIFHDKKYSYICVESIQ